MSVLGKIFSAGASELVKNVGGVLDNLTTTKEEKLEAETKIKDLVMGYEAEMQKQVTERWKVDMQSDSWLSKNIRPLVLIFLTISYVIGWYLSYPLDSITGLLSIVIGGYFGSRGVEKVFGNKLHGK